MVTKTCTKCGVDKPLTDFYKQSECRDGLTYACKKCKNKFGRSWALAHKEEERKRAKKFREANKEVAKLRIKRCYENKKVEYNAQKNRYRAANKEKLAAANRQYLRDNRARYRDHWAKRHALKLGATPKWANGFFISEIYDLAERRTKCLGVKYSVDHIVPLKHELVCGLHCEQNLQVIPALQNYSKSNHYWPDMP